MRANVLFLSFVLLLSACGGGGGGGGGVAVTPAEKTSAELAQMCSPDNRLKGDALEPTRPGTLADERRWIRAYLNERYLWYKDIPVVNASDPRYQLSGGADWENFIRSINNYFDDLLTPKYTSSGAKVDRFSFLTATYSW